MFSLIILELELFENYYFIYFVSISKFSIILSSLIYSFSLSYGYSNDPKECSFSISFVLLIASSARTRYTLSTWLKFLIWFFPHESTDTDNIECVSEIYIIYSNFKFLK